MSRTILAGGRVLDGTGAPVLQATSASAAALMGLEAELGALEPGKRADVVAVDGDPFELATLPDRIAGVWRDGRPVAGRA